jgi:hypothetical protein
MPPRREAAEPRQVPVLVADGTEHGDGSAMVTLNIAHREQTATHIGTYGRHGRPIETVHIAGYGRVSDGGARRVSLLASARFR